MLGVSETAVCVRCHQQGDPGYLGAQAMRQRIELLSAALGSAEQTVSAAERSGVEMSDARLQLASANEGIVKARVQIHEFKPSTYTASTAVAMAAATKADEMGAAGLRERDVRRRGLLFSLATILVTICGLWFLLRRLKPQRT
jgi:hypothetical protein